MSQRNGVPDGWIELEGFYLRLDAVIGVGPLEPWPSGGPENGSFVVAWSGKRDRYTVKHDPEATGALRNRLLEALGLMPGQGDSVL